MHGGRVLACGPSRRCTALFVSIEQTKKSRKHWKGPCERHRSLVTWRRHASAREQGMEIRGASRSARFLQRNLARGVRQSMALRSPRTLVNRPALWALVAHGRAIIHERGGNDPNLSRVWDMGGSRVYRYGDPVLVGRGPQCLGPAILGVRDRLVWHPVRGDQTARTPILNAFH
jgi:hypothetical protein